MSLLENELVKKYFGDQPGDITGDYCIMAYRVLAAMQEPIAKGERYLAFLSNGLIREYTADCNVAGGILGGHLRLPFRFQTPEKKECRAGFLKCMDCGEEIIHKSSVKFHPSEYMGHSCPTWREKSGCHCSDPDPVEAKIKEIIDGQPMTLSKSLNALRELVALVRSTKEKQND